MLQRQILLHGTVGLIGSEGIIFAKFRNILQQLSEALGARGLL
jgi:hypothetical protein